MVGQNAETLALVASLRETVQRQAQELEALQSKLNELSTKAAEVRLLLVVHCYDLTLRI